MKTKAIFLGGALVCSAVLSYGQLNVNSDGSVRTSKLSVNTQLSLRDNIVLNPHSNNGSLSNNKYLFIQNTFDRSRTVNLERGIYVRLYDKDEASCIGVHGEVDGYYIAGPYVNSHIGVLGQSTATIPSGTTPQALTIGVAGVVEATSSADKRIAIGGFTNGMSSVSYRLISGNYAGYFDGAVKVTGTLTVPHITYSSDERLKKSVLSLGNDRVLDKLMLLKPIAYNFKQVETELDSLNSKKEKVKFTVKRYDEKSQLFQKKHYGLSAQELQKVYPDLVYEDGDGYLAINYTGLIPLLLQAVQEQQATIEKQQAAIQELQKRLPDYGIVSSKTASAQGEQVTK